MSRGTYSNTYPLKSQRKDFFNVIERNIDYIQASLWLSEAQIIMKGYRPVSPIRFYKRGYLHPVGWRVYFGNPKSKKASIVASGETMQSLRNDCWLDAEVLDWLLSKGAQVSRLDLAVTEWIEDELVTLEDVQTWYEKDLIESPLIAGGARVISGYDKERSAQLETFYVGSMKGRGKKGIFRAYDKGIELNLEKYMVTRLELEMKGKNAHNTARRLAESNDIAGNFRSRFNVKAKEFERVMDADAVVLRRGAAQVKEDENETVEKRWNWLMTQVAPSLKQAIKDEQDAGRGDDRLTKFLIASGLMSEMRRGAVAYAKFVDYTDSVKTTKISSLDLD